MKAKLLFIPVFLYILFSTSVFGQKYQNGTRLLKGAEVMSATPLQLDYVLEKLADTARITVNLHEGKTHLVLDDGSGKWREWWYYMGKWQVKGDSGGNDGSSYTLPPATYGDLGGVIVGSGLEVREDGWLSVPNPEEYNTEYPIPAGEYIGTNPISAQINGLIGNYQVMRSTFFIFVKTLEDLKIPGLSGASVIVDFRAVYYNHTGEGDHLNDLYNYEIYPLNYNDGKDYFRIKSGMKTGETRIETNLFSEEEAAYNEENNFFEIVPGLFILDYVILVVDWVLTPV